LAPPVPPAPIKGATQQAVGISDTLPGAALSGAIAGVTTGMAAANLGWAAGPIGVGVGLATTFLNL
jgi:hypothetical protein